MVEEEKFYLTIDELNEKIEYEWNLADCLLEENKLNMFKENFEKNNKLCLNKNNKESESKTYADIHKN